MIRKSITLIALSSAIFLGTGCGGGGGGGDGRDAQSGGGDGEVVDVASKLPTVCPVILDILPGMNIKYKSQNVHGGRGPSFIMGCESNAKQYWPISTYLATFPIYSVKGNEIGRFTVYDQGSYPYGNRSYSGLPGGYPADSSTLMNSALAEGSSEIYVNTKGGVCFKVNTPLVDQGTIGAIAGRGHC